MGNPNAALLDRLRAAALLVGGEAEVDIKEVISIIDGLEADAALWREHKGSFAVLQKMLDAASPLVLNKLKAEDAVKDAA